ncbi:MAG: hypothetical protein LBC02_13935 [Planctomycetaceae bacterium]|nr:hypothetical protein [Planctomycetaceae bacterium]
MTVECEVILLFCAVFNGYLGDFVTSDNVYYVRLSRLFSHYNDFNGTEDSLLPLQSMFHYLIVKDHTYIY